MSLTTCIGGITICFVCCCSPARGTAGVVAETDPEGTCGTGPEGAGRPHAWVTFNSAEGATGGLLQRTGRRSGVVHSLAIKGDDNRFGVDSRLWESARGQGGAE